ncbi:fatty acid synthase subunit beta domain-containing protein [Gordonia sp. CPCC 205333]|uniref:fatty acid synthase subunit beta domain-containing protein n=1 Tax=Gordonia sp. CPCC 205333 TaxID=3140790 RepID=UPI003AF3364A
MTVDQFRTDASRAAHADRPSSLIDRIAAGEPYAVSFGGQGVNWLPTLAELVIDAELERSLGRVIDAATRLLDPVAGQLLIARPDGFAPMTWVHALDAGEATPTENTLTSAPLSVPGIVLTQIAAIAALRKQGLDTVAYPPTSIVGHSQGVLAVDALSAEQDQTPAGEGALLALAHLIGAAGGIVAARRGLSITADGSPMLSITNVVPAQVDAILADYAAQRGGSGRDASDSTLPVVAIRNGRRSVVVAGAPRHLAALRDECERLAAAEADDRKRKVTGGSPFAPDFDSLDVSIAFHHPGMAEAVDLVATWAAECGLDAQWARRHATSVFIDHVDWVSTIDDVVADGANWILDFGPADVVTRLSVPLVRGAGVGLVATALRVGQRNLFSPGGVPEVPRPWAQYAPRLVTLPDGRTVVDTAFTRLTGRSPILLAGMTPTTVDPAIVAAAANAGHWAELAGGGQVTEEIFAQNVAKLTELLEPGRQAQFNSLFLDPYLWKLQLGGNRIVQKARAQGAPLDGVIVTAGIPELDDAVALVDELAEAGLRHVAFKPGTVSQIRDVIRIAAEMPHHPIIVHIEGGRAGGHHSWEDLDDLLLATYGELRARTNVVVCVGGGIGTPDRASEYLLGTWAHRHHYPTMPLDGVLVGTAAMATLEAATAPEVKQLLVDTEGCDEWIGAGHAAAGIASGRSQLGADIHEIDNTASRCGRLLDEVAGDADLVADRRDEIVSAMAQTAKPYFGDVARMTYREWLERYATLAVGDGQHDQFPWADVTWQRRFIEMCQRTEARMNDADTGAIPTMFGASDATDDPHAALDALVSVYPAAEVDLLHPADVAFFIELCKTPGKPVNFVPVIDKDVRRWWRSDSLWQAHDSRYGADAVCIIPGPVAVAGITRVDEPVGDLLNRFEARVAEDLATAGEQPFDIDSRRRGQLAGAGAISALLAADDVRWAGRMVPSPIALLGDRDQWEIVDPRRAEHAPSGAVIAAAGESDTTTTTFDIIVPIAKSSVRIPVRVPASILDGGSPIVGLDDASVAMLDILRVAAGGELAHTTVNELRVSSQTVVAWDADSVADHAAVTGYTLPTSLRPTTTAQELGFAVPDTLVGACWPSVFSVIGAARTADGVPVVEGLLDLVHLDHSVHVVGEIPSAATQLRVDAAAVSVVDANVGRVVEVEVGVVDVETEVVVTSFVERFAIRGRLGEAELADPQRAGGASSDERSAQRKLLRSATITAPHQMNGFAFVSGDHNPIHTDVNAAKLAGLGTPIVHGMWLSAAAQQVVTATDARNPIPAPRPIRGWTARFLGMVRTGDQVAIRVDRVGLDAGREVIEVTAKVDDNLVMAATALLDAPRTVYAFPGQGIQSKGMGLDARSRSKAAREIWDRADTHTRAALGFSILAVVRDNPTTLVADGVTYQHPDGVLYLTQFTQVAMATLGVAQIAELKESGGFVDDAITCGHSVGEYNALAACAGVLPLEAVLEVVFQRGSAMHHLVPRDDLGRSDYRMAAIRPSQFGLADDHVADYVAQVGSDAGEFLEVVNLNLRGSQYAIAGTVRGLEHLEADIDRRRAEFGGKRAFILVPGIDVPFHSTVLRDGVPAFRERLAELLPADLDPNILIGRYIPNLVPRLFNLSREFVTEIAELVPSEPLNAVLADFDDWAIRPSELTRVVLIELLAWQFASPVRWIETQDLLFCEPEQGGLAIQRFVEIGVKSAPTLSGLATNTLKLDGFGGAVTEVLNVERDSAVVLAQDEGVEPEEDSLPDVPAESVEEGAPAAAAPVPAAPAAAAGPRPDDLRFGPADAVTAVIALWTKIRTDQIGAVDTIEALCDGVSSRRNQLLLDVGAELNLGAIDGAAEADMTALASTVETLARGYRPLGAVLTDAVGDQMRKVLGPVGKRPSYITDRVADVWQLESGWGLHTLVALALGTREGASVRGGDLGDLLDDSVGTVDALDALIDRAVASVGAAQGISVSLPSAGGSGGTTVDAAALSEFTEAITGRSGALASAAYTVLSKLGLVDDESVALPEADDEAAVLAERVSAELGSDWARTVAPSFDENRAVLVDDRWASAREDLARLWLLDDEHVDTEFESLTTRFVGAGHTVAQQATWWQGKALALGNSVHARAYGAIAHEAEDPNVGTWSDDIAVVTGASAASIAAAVVGELLAGGATVIATTSRLDSKRLDFYKELYRNNARKGAALWVAPANLASYTDVDDLVEWIGGEQTENLGSTTGIVKPSMKPTLLFPFAAPRVAGDLTDAGGRAELEMKVLLWSVERLIAGLADVHADHNIDARVHVVLPGSPNRGMFGGDGAYGESKAALDALVTRWSAEESWQSKTTLAHALIGWVRGTGLMGHNDGMVAAVEAAGVQTWATEEMAAELLKLCTPAQRAAARSKPIEADFTAGLDPALIDLKALASAASETDEDSETPAVEGTSINALPAPARARELAPMSWPEINSAPQDMVVIVGAGELGPYGSARTRFEMEVDERLSAAGVLELAWNTGLITWEATPKPGWYDTESGDPVAEADIADRYHDEVVARCGIRRYADDNEMIDNSAPLLTSVFLDDDLSFVVATEAEARAFASADPERTKVAPNAATGDWQVTRLAGTEIRVPRRFALSRTVGGQIPTGFDPTRWGVSADMVESVDRVALWNLVATVDAFLSSGFSPEELMRWVHPGLVANTQGTGMGGMTSMRSLYLDTLLGEAKANDILQEALPNVVAAHVVQSYIGSYGAMIHPVAACATAAVSVEEGVDKIKLGKAMFAVAGGFDDLGIEGIVGFGDMSATADSDKMSARGIDDRRFSRANDRRRGGFVESNGGGTVLLARGDVAEQMGLPVLGVVAHAQSFGDGVHTSIPAPGLGALGAARGGRTSPLATALKSLGVSPDDVAVISKHDTSTRANDPNEAKLHEELASAIGRNDGAPLFVVSQKSLTGHAKGGAAAFQLIGLCQMLGEGVIPPNRSLDCVDDAMEKFSHLVWPRETLRMAGRFPLKAGLLTSLGFGHVSGLIAVVHPEAFVASLDESARDAYRVRRAERLRDGNQRILDAMCGGSPAYRRPPNRRFDEAASEARQETDLLLSADGRLDVDGTYEAQPAR